MEITFRIVYEFLTENSRTLWVVLGVGVGTVSYGLYALGKAKKMVGQFPALDPDKVMLEITGGNQN